MAQSLRDMEIPAEAAEYNAGLGFSLEGRADVVGRTDEMLSIDIVWSLRARSGASNGSYTQSVDVPENKWRDGDTSHAARVGDEAANIIVALIGGEDPSVAAAPQPQTQRRPEFPTVSVTPVEGAPGNGRESLMLAVLQSLSLNGVARDDINPDVILNCRVSVTPYDRSLQFVEITWNAMTPDGSEIGSVKLENTIPVGALDEAWGPTAFAIADAAAPDLLSLLSNVPAN